MKRILIFMIMLLYIPFFSADAEEIRLESADLPALLAIDIETGTHWIHKLQVMPLIRIKNRPQMVFWLETPSGEFIETLWITERSGKQNWRGAPGDKNTVKIRREEALPHWAHSRDIPNPFGGYMPVRTNPVPDAVTTATPSESPRILTGFHPDGQPVVLKAEINHSADFNADYPADADSASANFSGGPWGSGQPALVWAVTLDPSLKYRTFDMKLAGHSDPDGSDGVLYQDLSGLTTALEIVGGIRVAIE